MPPDRGLLQLECEAPLLVRDARELLGAAEEAYEGLVAFDLLTADRLRYRSGRRLDPFDYLVFGGHFMLSGDPLPASSFVGPEETLVLQRAQLLSPGFWEFLGNLNPLEQLRKYLDDRHRRRQDLLYREAAERRRLEHENELREAEVRQQELQNEFLEMALWRERIQFAREAGLPEADIITIFNHYIARPLQELDGVVSRFGVVVGELQAVREDS